MRLSGTGRERGQVVPLLAALIVCAGLAMIGLARLGAGAVERAGAGRAADAAALAGAAEGQGAANRLASANGAVVSRYDQSANGTEVGVGLGKARAVARARRDGGGAGTNADGASPALQAALARATQLLGHRPGVVRARGVVVDLTVAGFEELAARAAEAGLCPSGPNQMRVCGAQ